MERNENHQRSGGWNRNETLYYFLTFCIPSFGICKSLTRTSRNQKGKAAQKGMTPQGGEKGEKQEAFPTAAFPDRDSSTMKRIRHLEYGAKCG
jgi:hypothetical protein